MSTLRAILEIYGSLDAAVIQSDDPLIAETVDRLLPGASTNTEWYREIESFMFSTPRGGARTEPDPINALREINDDRTRRDHGPTIPELSRLVYGLGAIIRLQSVRATGPAPKLYEGDTNRPLLADVLALAGPHDTFDANRRAIDEHFDEVMDEFATTFTSWRAWNDLKERLQGMEVLSADVAAVPLCQASVVTVDGIESVVVDAELTTDKVSLNALKAVVDPRNWHKDYPSFFCKMEYKGKRGDHWRKVLEHVGFCDIDANLSPRLHTMLKFYKTTLNESGRYEARLDYDLNDPVLIPPGDGKITVDRGFINMWSTVNDPTQKGVAVRTRKVAHIEGLRPYTMKRFVCAFGYGFAVVEMLFGSAMDYKAGDTDYTPWEDPTSETAEQESTSSQQQAQGTSQKPHPDNSAASTAISMVAKCVQDLSVKQFDLADKWLAGQLTVEDLTQYTAEVGARIASDPWKFIKAISQPKGY